MHGRYVIFCTLFTSMLFLPFSRVSAEYAERCIVAACNAGYYSDGEFHDYVSHGEFFTSCAKCPGKQTASGGWQNGLTDPDEYPDGIGNCYMPKNVAFSDSAGTYVYTSECHYSY